MSTQPATPHPPTPTPTPSRQPRERNILFVCTGNTCRSPMAQAIAAHLLARNPAKTAGIHAESAGLSASQGSAPTREALDALRTLSIPPPTSASRPLTREVLRDADAVFVMTRAHLQAIQALDPSAVRLGKASLLDPAGNDIPDPIGGSTAQYSALAKDLLRLIEARLKEFAP